MIFFFQQQPVFDSFLLAFAFDGTTHCHQQCASTHLANSASPISFNRLFSWGHDPFTHACKARPLTDVGWTSLSVSLSLSLHSTPSPSDLCSRRECFVKLLPVKGRFSRLRSLFDLLILALVSSLSSIHHRFILLLHRALHYACNSCTLLCKALGSALSQPAGKLRSQRLDSPEVRATSMMHLGSETEFAHAKHAQRPGFE